MGGMGGISVDRSILFFNRFNKDEGNSDVSLYWQTQNFDLCQHSLIVF